MTRAVIYARVSDPGIEKDLAKREAKKRQDTDNQLIPLRELVSQRGWLLVNEYVDVISSVKKRPQFDQMLQDAFAGKFSVLVTVKIDRVARSVPDFVHFLQKMKDYKVRYLAVTQGIDTDESNAAASLLINMLSAIAQFEREIISERVKAGLARKRAKGETWGRAPAAFDAAKAQALIDGGMSIRQAANHLGVKRGFLFKRVKAYKNATALETKEI